MNSRISRLRQNSLDARPSVSPERARLITAFYQSGEALHQSVPVQRALAFKHVLENKSLCIQDDELIVGERGPAPKATPTFPEICIHSQQDLEIIHGREKVSFNISPKTREEYRTAIEPFWRGVSVRDKIFAELPENWKAAYHAGIFTEFQEQRAPGHTVLDGKIYQKGMRDLQDEIQTAVAALNFEEDADALAKRDELRAMSIAADAVINYARRHAEQLRSMHRAENNQQRKSELQQMAEICSRVPACAPRTFWEALQYYWFVHLGVITELNPWDSFNPGRLDQHLYPFYRKEMEAGTLNIEQARELLQAFWIKFNNHPSPPKMGVTARESNTYTDFTLINLGGVTPSGHDAVNELSYLILDVIEEMRLLQPGSMVQISKKTPDRFLHRALDIIKTGFGQPSVFNTDAVIQELLRQGKSLEDARSGGCSGCVETGAFGKEAYILTGYFNLPKILELTLNRGIDPGSGNRLGPDTGSPENFNSFEDLLTAWQKQVAYFADLKIKGSNIIERIYARSMPVPFLSLLIDDCIKKGRDYNNGGARYNTFYIQGVGLGSITDSLAALKYHVFDKKRVTFNRFMDALSDDFESCPDLHNELVNETPKYGNDNAYADEILEKVFGIFYHAVNGRPASNGGVFRINLLPTTCHVYFGSVTGALPDGRKAGQPLSEGISPVQGADRLGPTAVLKSASRIDHIRTGGTLLNQKFTPDILAQDSGKRAVGHLIRAYFRLDGHHIQFNVVSAETLRRAQKQPGQYRDLIVRVAGYSDYFVDLTTELQDEIIRRTEHVNCT